MTIIILDLKEFTDIRKNILARSRNYFSFFFNWL